VCGKGCEAVMLDTGRYTSHAPPHPLKACRYNLVSPRCGHFERLHMLDPADASFPPVYPPEGASEKGKLPEGGAGGQPLYG
jgi:hypothetical protein